MSIQLILATLRDKPSKAKCLRTIECLRDVVCSILRESGVCEKVETSSDAVLLDLPGGTAEIYVDHAIFPIEELDLLTMKVVFEVAKVGDMAIITEGGDYAALLASPSQRKRLPDETSQTKSLSPVFRTPEELEELLNSWYRVHSNFRNSVSTSPTAAKQPAPTQPARQASDSVVKQFRWDSVLNQLVEVTRGFVYLILHRFDPTGNDIPKHPAVLKDLLNVCQTYIAGENAPSAKLVLDESSPPISLRLLNAGADVWASQAEIRFLDLTESLTRLIWELARAGDMSVVGESVVILVDDSQRLRIPNSWQHAKQILHCEFENEMQHLLSNICRVSAPREDVAPVTLPEEPAPGTFPSPRRSHLYIEAKPGEDATRHQTLVYSFVPSRRDEPRPVSNGLLMSEFWQLETPLEQRFVAYSFGGNRSEWFAHLREFASFEDRAIGEIVNFENFVQNNGQAFRVSECNFRHVASHKRQE